MSKTYACVLALLLTIPAVGNAQSPFSAIQTAIESLEGEISDLRAELEAVGDGQAEILEALQTQMSMLNDALDELHETVEGLPQRPSEKRWISPAASTGLEPLLSDTMVAVVNPGQESTTVDINFYRTDGSRFSSTQFELAPGTSNRYLLPGRRTVTHGWIEVIATHPVLPSGVQVNVLEPHRSQHALTFYARD